MQLVYLNDTFQYYEMELVILIECADLTDHALLAFGVETAIKKNTVATVRKQVVFGQREAIVIGVFRLKKSIGYIVFDDGLVWTYDNEKC